jgi:ComF family protein
MISVMEASAVRRIVTCAGRWLSLGVRGVNQLLWPAVCANCDVSVAETDRDLCRVCWDQVMACAGGDYCPRCGRNASRYGLVAGMCPGCQGLEIHFDGIARVGIYSDALRQMIIALKHDHCELLPTLCGLARSALEGGSFHDRIDWLVPVPLHWTRRFARGYNQSLLIARGLKHPTARISTDLVRIRRTPIQPTAATPAQRARNVKGVFAVRPGHPFTGKTVCLVDDVKTSGATLNECARTLKEAGAVGVFACVLAVAGQNPT